MNIMSTAKKPSAPLKIIRGLVPVIGKMDGFGIAAGVLIARFEGPVIARIGRLGVEVGALIVRVEGLALLTSE